MASDRTVYHVLPDASAEAWMVTQENGEFRGEFDTKREAVEFATNSAKAQEPSQVKVHNSDGNVDYERIYGEDPRQSST